MNPALRPPCNTPLRTLAFGLALLVAGLLSATAQPAVTPEQAAFFETKILPVLVDSCFECHSKKAGQKKGGLSLDTRFALRDGGNSGPGVVPGQLEQSWIWLAVSHTEPDYEMPPKSKLPAAVIADFKTWIEMGAPDTRAVEQDVRSDIDIEAGKQFWSFQKPTATPPPEVADPAWANTAIDRFVAAKRSAANLQAAPPADGPALLRRLHYDLIGMPPTLAEAKTFQQAWQSNPDRALRETVDRLLDSPRFGERWGRHWLDLARYAESNGKGSNQAFPNAWRYRDYVIDSVNADKPFNRFILEQLAGDLITIKSDADWQRNLIATGFLALGPKDLREKSHRQFTMDMVDEQINTTTTAFLGLTVSCARCHDHKTDPIPTRDYYALAGVFLSSNTHFGTDGSGGRFNKGNLIELPLANQTKRSFSAAEIAAMRAELQEVKKGLRAFHEAKRSRMQNGGDASQPERGGKRNSARGLRERESQLTELLGSLTGDGQQAGTVKAYAMGMTDKAQTTDANVLVRGEIDSPAQRVPRGFLQVLDAGQNDIPTGKSGRLELAQWIASEQHPLTARVYVNRVWQKLFGRGLVVSVDNFGATGQAPSHPELLDHLAVAFVQNGWSLKTLLREIVLTRTYRMASDFDATNHDRDPDNIHLWRSAPRRLDAESFRDTILAVSGQLDLEPPTRSPVAEHSLEELGRRGSPNVTANFPPHRSVYLPPIRDAMPEFIEVFDGADPNAVTGRRQPSNDAAQSLFLMNSPFIIAQSRHFAERVRHEAKPQAGEPALDAQIRRAFERAYGRVPNQAERDSAHRFHRAYLPSATRAFGEAAAERAFLELFCQGLLCSAELRYLH